MPATKRLPKKLIIEKNIMQIKKINGLSLCVLWVGVKN